ncbi:uncharacterized protein B0T15DRAFT_500837 [Chaetomium strumarium]|uniref:Uncharacterized protein n=1 Tax=Chaetomium strumarium TaxID=1170767 RepID=A0AAJ0M534_9PEZI|nr:hypothetical protein B0T15DRAFT_500837 [Chaetomium strumarium]
MVAFTHALLAVGWLLTGAATVAHERFAAVATGVILLPREYHDHPPELLDKRQGGCSPTSHPCNDIGPLGVGHCCPNSHYCIIDDTGQPGCCFIGNTVCQSPCNASQYRCNSTATLTTTTTTTTTTTSAGTITNTNTATLTITTTSLVPACCGRVCTEPSHYLCPTGLGTGCCPYGAACGSANQCFITPSSSSSPPGSVMTIPPEGCTTGQISCAASLGGGCCGASQSCTLVAGAAHCAALPATPPAGSDFRVEDDPGLSAGAKAGIAVGVVVGFGLLVGAATWVCLVRRRRERSEEGVGHGDGVGEESSRATRPRGVVGRVLGGSTSASGIGARGGGGREMSEANSDVLSSSPSAAGGGGRRLDGLAQDYFGPAPAVGPYSETHSTSGLTTPGVDRGGVPVQPHEPGDIAVPVEIDSRLREARRAPAGLTTASPVSRSHEENDAEIERYELYGSDIGQISPSLPSPYNGGLPSPPIDDRYR